MQYKHQGDIFGGITKAENKQQKKKISPFCQTGGFYRHDRIKSRS